MHFICVDLNCADPDGDILKDVHNTELRYLKFKYAHGDAETGKVAAICVCLYHSISHALGAFKNIQH